MRAPKFDRSEYYLEKGINSRAGEIKEHGHFLDGASGYTIWEGEAADIFKNLSMTVPYYDYEVHEFIPYEKSRGIVMEVFKARAEAANK